MENETTVDTLEDLLKFAPIGPYRLNYLDVGQGTPVVLIHGLAGDYKAWLPQIAALKDHFRVIAFDSRGAGKSTQVDEPVTTAELAEDTLQLMDYLKIAQSPRGRSFDGGCYCPAYGPESSGTHHFSYIMRFLCTA